MNQQLRAILDCELQTIDENPYVSYEKCKQHIREFERMGNPLDTIEYAVAIKYITSILKV